MWMQQGKNLPMFLGTYERIKTGGFEMLSCFLAMAMVMTTLLFGYMAHEEIQSQKAYRRAAAKARVR
jgi:hypothetical protein